MLFVDLSTGEARTKVQLMALNKHMSLPAAWTDATLEALNVARVEKVDPPALQAHQVAVFAGVEQVDGEWRESWTVEDAYYDMIVLDENGDEVTRTKQEQIDAKEAADLAALEAKARSERDTLLADTDWIAIKAFETGTTVPADMSTYRQELRDVPSQAGFPGNITWPTKPE